MNLKEREREMSVFFKDYSLGAFKPSNNREGGEARERQGNRQTDKQTREKDKERESEKKPEQRQTDAESNRGTVSEANENKMHRKRNRPADHSDH